MNAKLLTCGIVLSLVALCGCVPRQLTVTCVMPPLPPELNTDPPPVGWFTQELGRILDQGSTPSPDAPTN